MKIRIAALLIAVACSCSAQESSVWETKRSAWLTLPAAERPSVERLSSDLKAYLGTARSALDSNREVIRMARASGFAEFTNDSQVKPGARLIVNNRDRAVMLIIVGQRPLIEGMRVVGTHQDAPHIRLKARPVEGRGGLALLNTIYYGGIKKYQWANIPLALVGRISTSDARNIDVSIGLKPGEPVFVIPDNAPHSDAPLRSRTYNEVLKGEELDPVAGSVPLERGGVTAQVIQALTATYKIKEEDLVAAELQLVPASQPADVGFDRGIIGAYGQDDRLGSFCAVRAALDTKGTPAFTAVAYLTNFEETGSGNNTGAQSEFFYSTISRLLAAQGAKDVSLALQTALPRSAVMSTDMNDGLNPIFGEATSESSNAAKLGFGPTLKAYGGQFDPTSEFAAKVRGLMDRNGIPWQTQTPRVDIGGGGTIGKFFSARNMEVIDFGIPLLSMHSPFEMSSKVDAYYLYRLMSIFMAWDGQ